MIFPAARGAAGVVLAPSEVWAESANASAVLWL